MNKKTDSISNEELFDSFCDLDYLMYNAKKAMRKQIAEPPNDIRLIPNENNIFSAECSVCGYFVRSNHKYCPECGQKIDWSILDIYN